MKTVKFLVGYRGVRTDEEFYAAGEVADVGDDLADFLVDCGKAKFASAELEALPNLSIKELKARLKESNLPTSGKKAELVERLESA